MRGKGLFQFTTLEPQSMVGLLLCGSGKEWCVGIMVQQTVQLMALRQLQKEEEIYSTSTFKCKILLTQDPV